MVLETKKDGRGRPVGSPTREKIKQILGALGCAYGYEIHKVYRIIDDNKLNKDSKYI